MGRNFCQACSFQRFGVKTRKAIEHTCGQPNRVWPKVNHPWIPTREELDKYLKRLAELMKEDYICFVMRDHLLRGRNY